MTESTVEGAENSPGGPSAELSRIVDWMTAGALVLTGLFTTIVGIALYALVEREAVVEAVADGTISSPELTDAELVDVSMALSTWGGVGVTITGLLLLVSGIGFIIYRNRLHRREQPDRMLPDTTTLAIVGAVVTGVTSFVPFSPILGGLVAGYLRSGETRQGIRVGAYAGVCAAIPIGLLLLFLLGGFVITALELGLGGVGVVISLVFVFSLLFSVAVLVGLSALGGYLGTRLRDRQRTTPA